MGTFLRRVNILLFMAFMIGVGFLIISMQDAGNKEGAIVVALMATAIANLWGWFEGRFEKKNVVKK